MIHIRSRANDVRTTAFELRRVVNLPRLTAEPLSYRMEALDPIDHTEVDGDWLRENKPHVGGFMVRLPSEAYRFFSAAAFDYLFIQEPAHG